MPVRIRPAIAADADTIGTLAAEFQAYLRSVGSETDFDWGAAKYLRDGFGADPAFEGVVAEVDGRVGGFALYHWGYDTDRGERYLYLMDLFVSGPYRGKGVGGALMARLGAIGQGRGATLIAWSVMKENRSAVRFYEGIGARSVDDQQVMWCPIPFEP